MQPCVIPEAIRNKPVDTENNTAFWIFDRGALFPFRVNSPHFKARTGGMDDPVMGLSKERYQDVGSQMVFVQDTIISLVDYFMEGASLEITPEVSVAVYDRIYNHIHAHMTAMMTNKMYNIGDTFSVFEDLVEFGCMIYPTVDAYKAANRIANVSDDPFTSMLGTRPNFMTMFTKDPHASPVPAALQSEVKVSPLVTMLERMKVYYNGGYGWE